jgi:hypothetical protein
LNGKEVERERDREKEEGGRRREPLRVLEGLGRFVCVCVCTYRKRK